MPNIIVEFIKTQHMNLSPDDVKDHGIYCFHTVSSGSGSHVRDIEGKTVYIPLGRNNKPVGVATEGFLNYADYVDTHGMVFNIDPQKMGKVWDKGSNDAKLYVHDDCIPESRRDYAKHMNIIMSYAEPHNVVRH